ncbi:hypothetical protein C8R45DRAFT_923303 [Mycena sanguinolenta]|nr:hypothetical protein C8R45DRAFT_923303 [Mycena sanguinolenta]
MQFKALASIVALSAIVSVNARPGHNEICLRICAPMELSCGEGSHPQKLGHCNTCCKDEENSVKSVKAEQICGHSSLISVARSGVPAFLRSLSAPQIGLRFNWGNAGPAAR